MAVIILGYIFFFTSSCLFHKHRDLLFSNMNTTLKLSDSVSLTLKRWTYSPNDNAMSVMLSVQNTGLTDVVLNREVMERHTTRFLNIETGTDTMNLKSKLEYPASNMVVVSILGVPPGFEEIALVLQLAGNENQQNENDIVYFYTNRNTVTVVDKIESYSENDYRIEYLRMQIDSKMKKIEELEKTNENLQKDNEKYQASIEELKANQQYETADEVKATLQRISSFERQINTNNETIQKNKYSIIELEKSIEDIEATIKKLEEKMNDTL